MRLAELVWRGVTASPLHSGLVLACALLVAGLALSTALIGQGAQASLHSAAERLGADIMVVAEGAEGQVENALIMGIPARTWLPERDLEKIAAIPGVAAVSPQLYLTSLYGASCCSVSEMLLVAYDPATDFALRPWLSHHLTEGLRLGEAVGGSDVFVPEGEAGIRLYGTPVTLRGNLEPTGTNLDHTLFFTFETAREIAQASHSRAEKPLEIPPHSISAALVRVQPGADPQRVALAILEGVPGVTPVEAADLFCTFRRQIGGLLRAMLGILATTTALSWVLMGLVFSLAMNARRREIGILRALGAGRTVILRSLLAEAGLLGLGGAALGTGLACLAVYLFQSLIAVSLGVPYLFPLAGILLSRVGAATALTLLAVTLAALFPVLHIGNREPAQAMAD